MAGGMLNMVITAVDKATPNIGKVGKSLGKLGKVAGGIGGGLKNVALGAAGIAAGVATFAVGATAAAADEEKAVATLNAVLKQRGMLTDENVAKMTAQEAAMANLAISDDEYRASLSKATAFTNNFNDALAIQNAAAELAAGAGISLEEATTAVGKAYSGKGGKALTKYGVSTEKVVKGVKKQVSGLTAVNRVLAKYNGAATAAANTVSGKFTKAQIAANNLVEQFGSKFLPIAADAADWLATNAMPALSKALDVVAPIITDIGKGLADTFGPMIQDNITNMTKPGGVFDSVGKVVGPIFDDLSKKVGTFIGKLTGPDGLLTALGNLVGTLWGDGKGPLAVAVQLIGAALGGLMDIINGIVDAITALVTGIDNFLKASADAAGVEVKLAGGNLADQGGGMTGPQSQVVTETAWDFILRSIFGNGGGASNGSSSNPALNITLSSDIPLIVDAVNDAQGNAYTVITNTRGR
jgi:hypothetical protein